jgi:hypothetical protein
MHGHDRNASRRCTSPPVVSADGKQKHLTGRRPTQSVFEEMQDGRPSSRKLRPDV